MYEHNHCSCESCSCSNDENKDSGRLKTELYLSIAFLIIGVLAQRLFQFPQIIIGILFGLSVILSGWRVFIEGIKSFIKFNIDETTLMSIAVIAAFFLGEYLEAALVAILYNLGEALEDRAVENSRQNIEKLAEIRSDTARRMAHGKEEIVSAETVSIGETILVNPYERIPLDGTVISGISSVNTSALTGESEPMDAIEGTTVLSGMMNEQGPLTIKVTSDFQNSAATRIIAMVESASARKGKAEKLITRFAQIYTPIVIAMAVLLMVVPPLLGLGEFRTWLYRALIFLVASCPCSLVISIPLGFYAGIGGASKNGVLIKGGKFLEALSRTSAVVFDKTGTLTHGELQVSKINILGNISKENLLKTAASIEQYSAHPAAKAVLKFAGDIDFYDVENAAEIPGHGVKGEIEGKEVLCGRRSLLEKNNIDLNSAETASVYISVDGKLEGSLELNDTLKEDANEGIKALKNININRIVMLTGDNEKSAQEVAENCGITEFHSGLLPEQKVELMEEIRKESGKTVFVGDGINDAPVLAASDCGVAMGLGTDAAIEACDVVLTLDKPSKLAPSIKFAKRAMKVIRFNIIFALTVKAVVLVLAAMGLAPMWLAVFADVGVCIIAVINSTRILKFKL
jgi:Cd2+/Zn2+-exporting ATPase